MDIMTVNGNSFQVLRLLGKGKGGYSYLVTDGEGEYVLKQIPLVAKEGVGRLTFGQIWSRILQVLTMSAKK